MKIAVIGGGVSGLGAAYVLGRSHDVELFERDERAGGHTRTIRRDGLALDTGFLVHNVRNYPLLTRLFAELGVATQTSEMSFSVSCPCGLEYSGRRPFAQSRRAADPRFLSLLGEIGRWLLTAKRSLADLDEALSLRRYLDERSFSGRFRRHFLVPLTAALWSTAPGRALDYPAAAAIRFFDNHGMLGFGRHEWRYVTGGSDTYVRGARRAARAAPAPRQRRASAAAWTGRHRVAYRRRRAASVRRRGRRDARGPGARVARGSVARRVSRARRLRVHAERGDAAHGCAVPAEHRGCARFVELPARGRGEADHDLLPEPPAVARVRRRLVPDAERRCSGRACRRPWVFEHPLFTPDSLAAQRELPSLGGIRRTWFAGAHHGNGFHEDGLASGVHAARSIGVDW